MGASDAPHVAIVGGGLAGIATCRALAVRGIRCTLYEPQRRAGGIWADNYPGLHAQSHSQMFRFPELKYPEAVPALPSAADVRDYLDEYIREWDLEPHMHFNTRVTRVARDSTAKFVVETTSPLGNRREKFSHVVMCTGLFSTLPNKPEIPGQEAFAGRIMHTSERKDDDAELAGQHVVVVGCGKSALDACEAAVAAGAASVTQVFKRMRWLLPTRAYGLSAALFVSHPLWLLLALPKYPTRCLGPLGRLRHALLAPVRWFCTRVFERGVLAHYRLPRRFRPRTSIYHNLQSHPGALALPSYLGSLRSGAIRARMGSVVSCGVDSVTVRSTGGDSDAGVEETVPAGVIVLGTGWKRVMDPLEPAIVESLQPGDDGVYLYKHMLHPDVPGLAFVGSVSTYTSPLVFAVQAAWVAEWVAGNIAVPPDTAVREEMVRRKQAHAQYAATSVRSTIVLAYENRYMDELLKDMGTKALGTFGGPFGAVGNLLVRRTPDDLAAAVAPRGKRGTRRLTPPLKLKVGTMLVLAAVLKVVLR